MTRAVVRGGALVLLLVLFAGWQIGRAPVVRAQADGPIAVTPVSPTAPDAACKLCHVGKEDALTLPSGEPLRLGVDVEALVGSVHGAPTQTESGVGLYCTDCHTGRQQYRYPHTPNPAQNRREFRADVAQSCEQCHVAAELHNPGHLQARPDAQIPNCVDCHGGHAVASAAAFNADPIAACQSCHQTYDDAHVEDVHNEIVANFEPGQDCRACHADLPQPADAQCKACHSLLTRQVELSSGDLVEVHVEPDVIAGSMHGDREIDGAQYTALQCTDCHVDQQRYGFPHPRIDVATLRGLTIEMEQICQECHQEIYAAQRDGVHARAQAEGNLDAATCADCHGNHDIQDPDEPRERVSQTCSQCHSTINEQYATSVHGAALLGENNPDVPVCTDCHGVHNIEDPTTAQFRVESPDLCADCHADEEKMAKYGISTDVFETYVADFHGTTVQLFEKQMPWQETNKAVCYDCHGVHNILPADDENSQVIKENLLATCRQCHPDATANFPASWTSHFRPSWEHSRWVYVINLFYRILIPAVVGGFLLFIGSDVYFRIWRRAARRRESAIEDAPPQAPDSPANKDGEA